MLMTDLNDVKRLVRERAVGAVEDDTLLPLSRGEEGFAREYSGGRVQARVVQLDIRDSEVEGARIEEARFLALPAAMSAA
jgi:hypothetical protein